MGCQGEGEEEADGEAGMSPPSRQLGLYFVRPALYFVPSLPSALELKVKRRVGLYSAGCWVCLLDLYARIERKGKKTTWALVV
jgi:hypothetical protein